MEKPTSGMKNVLRIGNGVCSGIFGELRRRHKIKLVSQVPGVRESLIAILKTSSTTLSSFPSHRLHLILWRSDAELNVLLIFIPLSVRVYTFMWWITGSNRLEVDLLLHQTQQYHGFRL